MAFANEVATRQPQVSDGPEPRPGRLYPCGSAGSKMRLDQWRRGRRFLLVCSETQILKRSRASYKAQRPYLIIQPIHTVFLSRILRIYWNAEQKNIRLVVHRLLQNVGRLIQDEKAVGAAYPKAIASTRFLSECSDGEISVEEWTQRNSTLTRTDPTGTVGQCEECGSAGRLETIVAALKMTTHYGSLQSRIQKSIKSKLTTCKTKILASLITSPAKTLNPFDADNCSVTTKIAFNVAPPLPNSGPGSSTTMISVSHEKTPFFCHKRSSEIRNLQRCNNNERKITYLDGMQRLNHRLIDK